MRDWSRLLNSVAKLPYEKLVEEGKKTANKVLAAIEKYSDSDAAPMILVGLAAYTAMVDDELSPMEAKLVEEIIGVNQDDFAGFVRQEKADKKIVTELRDIAICMDTEELTDLATLLSLMFAVDGNISDEELSFLKELCN